MCQTETTRESCPSCGQYADVDGGIRHLHACTLGQPPTICINCEGEVIFDPPSHCDYCDNYLKDCMGMPQLCTGCFFELWQDGQPCPWGPGFLAHSPSTR